jgi:PAS domain S-box-containing protein
MQKTQARGEVARRESEQRYRLLFETNPHPMWVYDLETLGFLAVNETALAQYGYTEEEFLALGLADIRPPEDVPALLENVALRAPGLERSYWRHRRKDGTLIDVEIVSHPLVWEGREAKLVIAHDITEQRRAELEKITLAAHLELLLESTGEGLHGMDPDGRCSFINRAGAELLGYEPEEIIGRNMHELIHHSRRDGSPYAPDECPSIRTARDGVVRRDEDEGFWRRDGTWFPVSLSSYPIVTDGVVRGTVVSFTDISELRRLNEELEQRVRDRTAKLEEANADLEAFAYSVSHDLRAPLRAIDGFSRIVLQDAAQEVGPEATRLLGRVRENAQRMGQLIDGLLAFSKLGHQRISKREVDTGILVRSVLADLEPEREGRELEVVVGELPRVEADPNLLRHVFVNLLTNAFKYTRGREPARIEVGADVVDGELVFSVADTGVGFDPRYADKLFQVFQRLHRTEDYEGVGVGLALSARIVKRHGGRIWAEGTLGEGARFSFTLGTGEAA